MIAWILIAYISRTYGGAPVTAVFHSLESCENAATQLKKHSFMVDWAECFEDKK